MGVRPFVRPSVHPSVRPSIHPSICLSVCPSVHPSVRLSVHSSVHSYVRSSSKIKFPLINNNLAISHHKIVCKVANERYCNIFLIFGVVWGNGVKGSPLEGTKKTKKII